MRNDSWTNRLEIMMSLDNATQNKTGGPVVFHENGENFVENSEAHSIVLGSSGTGKSRRYILPMLHSIFEAKESAIIIDPKGECYRQTSYINSEFYNDYVIDFRDVHHSMRWNPLGAIQNLWNSDNQEERQRARDMVNQLGTALYPVSKADPFWQNSGKSLFVGLTHLLIENNQSNKRQITIADVYNIVVKGDAEIRKISIQSTNSLGSKLVHSYLSTASDTRGGIRSTFLEGLSFFMNSEGLISMLSANDLNITEIDANKPTRIFIIVPDETPIYNSLAAILCSQLVNYFINFAQRNKNSKLDIRLNIVIEELGNIGKSIGNLPFLMSASRSRNIRMHLVLQSLAQLEATYGREDAFTIRDNADILVSFRTTNLETLKELSEKCGERLIDFNGVYQRENLITTSQLGAMEVGQALVIIRGKIKFITWLHDYADMFDTSGWKEPIKPVVEYLKIDDPAEELNLEKEREWSSFFKDPLLPDYSKDKNDESSINLSPPIQHITSSKITRDKDIKDAIKSIDKLIERLKCDEVREILDKKELAIMSFDGEKVSETLFRQIQCHTRLKSIEIYKKLQNLPFKIKFKSIKAMKEASQVFREEGCKVVTYYDETD